MYTVNNTNIHTYTHKYVIEDTVMKSDSIPMMMTYVRSIFRCKLLIDLGAWLNISVIYAVHDKPPRKELTVSEEAMRRAVTPKFTGRSWPSHCTVYLRELYMHRGMYIDRPHTKLPWMLTIYDNRRQTYEAYIFRLYSKGHEVFIYTGRVYYRAYELCHHSIGKDKSIIKASVIKSHSAWVLLHTYLFFIYLITRHV